MPETKANSIIEIKERYSFRIRKMNNPTSSSKLKLVRRVELQRKLEVMFLQSSIWFFFSIKPLYTHANIYEAIHNLLITSQALVYIS